ncbi:MAG: hypothetical protein ABSE28_16655 [Candidatus Sulfotelmatobacter sp.]|jgi:hypothetical protein
MGTPPKAPKRKALARNSRVALTIDDNNFPYKVLLIRGTARLEPLTGIVPEYATAAERYFGPEQGKAWVTQMGNMISSMARIAITPDWVGLLDFQTRFSSALPLERATYLICAVCEATASHLPLRFTKTSVHT